MVDMNQRRYGRSSKSISSNYDSDYYCYCYYTFLFLSLDTVGRSTERRVRRPSFPPAFYCIRRYEEGDWTSVRPLIIRSTAATKKEEEEDVTSGCKRIWFCFNRLKYGRGGQVNQRPGQWKMGPTLFIKYQPVTGCCSVSSSWRNHRPFIITWKKLIIFVCLEYFLLDCGIKLCKGRSLPWWRKKKEWWDRVTSDWSAIRPRPNQTTPDTTLTPPSSFPLVLSRIVVVLFGAWARNLIYHIPTISKIIRNDMAATRRRPPRAPRPENSTIHQHHNQVPIIRHWKRRRQGMTSSTLDHTDGMPIAKRPCSYSCWVVSSSQMVITGIALRSIESFSRPLLLLERPG